MVSRNVFGKASGGRNIISRPSTPDSDSTTVSTNFDNFKVNFIMIPNNENGRRGSVRAFFRLACHYCRICFCKILLAFRRGGLVKSTEYTDEGWIPPSTCPPVASVLATLQREGNSCGASPRFVHICMEVAARTECLRRRDSKDCQGQCKLKQDEVFA